MVGSRSNGKEKNYAIIDNYVGVLSCCPKSQVATTCAADFGSEGRLEKGCQ